jgi:hypothetical protein
MKNKQQQIKIKPKKVKADPEGWIKIVKAVIKAHKKDFSFWRRIWATIIKKQQKDAEKEACKDVIARMDQKKLSMEEAQQMAIASANELQQIRKHLPEVLIYFLGGGTMLLCSVIFLLIRSPHNFVWQDWVRDTDVIFWTVMLVLNGVLFYIGWQKRKAFEEKLVINSVLSQASAAYAAARAPGKGGSLFEAMHYLEIIREKNQNAFAQKFGFGNKKKA